MECFAIYTYLHENDNGAFGAGNYLLYTFDQKGFCDRELLEDVYSEMEQGALESGPFVGPFEGISHVRDFVYRLSGAMRSKIYLLSVEQYNACLDKCSEASELLELMKEAGQMVEDESFSSGQRLWDRFFNRN